MLVSLLIVGLTAGGFVAARAPRGEAPRPVGAGEVAESASALPTPIPLPSATPLPTPLPAVDRETIVDTAVTYFGALAPFDVPPGLEAAAIALGVYEPSASSVDEPVADSAPAAPPSGDVAPPPDDGSAAGDAPADPTPAPAAPLPALPVLEPVEPVETPIPTPVPLPGVDVLETPQVLPLLP